MTAQVLPLPDHILTRSAAREVMRCEASTRAQLLLACEALALSPDEQDRIDAREARAAIWAQRGAELRPEAQRLAIRLAAQGETDRRRAERTHRSQLMAMCSVILALAAIVTAALQSAQNKPVTLQTEEAGHE